MDRPSTATVKRLFAVSGNRCTFPNCTHSLVEPESGKVVGRICHIKAGSPGGPRYDPEQTDEERHSFSNLLLMCPIHHDVIDADTVSYTVTRLTQMKETHESAQGMQPEPSDSVANQFIANISSNNVRNGSIIYSVNQSGGQIAHSITNIGLQQRMISSEAVAALPKELRQLSPLKFEIEVVHGDAEASRLGHQIKDALHSAGWECVAFASSMFPSPMTGVTVSASVTGEPVTKLMTLLAGAMLKPKQATVPGLDRIHILVGSQQ